ncbi:MAG: amidohydrolase family protein [Gammaproteobacteria bacterium]|nr:amidohydrolase family protein [Gammaproteobacteria bacterium]
MTPARADTLIKGAVIVTQDEQRRIIRDGALAIRGDRIAAVGTRAELEDKVNAASVIDGRRFVITPGFIDAHIHITGDPLTRGYVPDDISDAFGDTLRRWVIPRYLAHTPADERLSARLAAVEMLRAGTTCFLEAGTIRYLDEVAEGLVEAGIRGRIGAWVEGRAFSPEDDEAQLTGRAIRKLEQEVERFPADSGTRIAAWPILIGHSTNTDEVWKAAKALADANGLGVSAHMSPYRADSAWYLENLGRRPVEHLADIGVLGDNLCLTHLVHIDDREAALLGESGVNAILCPFAALKGAFGIGALGRAPEMAQAGTNIALGTDGYGSDLMQKMALVAGLFKDARQDTKIFPAGKALDMATLNGAKALQIPDEIGSIAPGKKADFVLHDTDRPEWRPLLNVLQQLVWCADGRGVHSVWVDGVRVVENYRHTLVDEDELYAAAQVAGEAIIKRSGIPDVGKRGQI